MPNLTIRPATSSIRRSWRSVPSRRPVTLPASDPPSACITHLAKASLTACMTLLSMPTGGGDETRGPGARRGGPHHPPAHRIPHPHRLAVPPATPPPHHAAPPATPTA